MPFYIQLGINWKIEGLDLLSNEDAAVVVLNHQVG